MSEKELVVYFGEDKAGVITQSSNAQLTFTYDDAWRFLPGATPLSMSMPLTAASHGNTKVEAFIDGLLPDNDDVRQRWGREFQVSARNLFALLSFVGHDVAGAAQFLNPNQAPYADGDPIEITELEIADQIRALTVDPVAWHFPGSSGRFSLAGAQRKFALLRRPDGWARPTGRLPSTHIFKLPIHGFEDQHINEHLCAEAARELGLIAERSDIMTFDDQQVIVVERYDRWNVEGNVTRIHQEDMCQALGIPTRNKYQSEGGPTPTDIVALLRRDQPNPGADTSILRFVDALLFNWLILNPDAHAKNYSVLLSGPQIRLAPLYDLASITPYEGGDVYLAKTKLAMNVGGEYRDFNVAGRHWRRFAGDADIDEQYVIGRAEELCDELAAAFNKACSAPAVAELGSELPQRLLMAIEKRATHCRKMLAR